MKLKKITLLILAVLLCNLAFAKINTGIDVSNNGTQTGKTAADCNSSTAQIELNINNVRTTLMTGGDLWWDLNNGRYEVPKIPIGSDAPSVHSIFAGALWIGGIDQFQNLKVAAQTYRQSGNDFWPGPLDDDGQIAQETCAEFDRFWVVYKRDIDEYLTALEEGNGEIAPNAIPDAVLQWPGKDNIYHESFTLPEGKELAPFWDADGDGRYDPTQGDYPVIDPAIEKVYADQMIWWMFNDKGNIHTETGGEAIGLEVGALAFAFATNDEVNNMTFYKYKVNNKSVQPIDSVFFGQWVDPDLGNYDDDFVGCVPEEGLGIVYNGTAVDGQYGENPPMLGVDFFRGPKVGEDEEGNPNYLGMSAFVYYDNDFSVRGNPENASHFYGYLAGVWKDGTPFTCGGNGYGGDESCDYIFPGDPSNPDEWSECSENNTPFDRRFLQSAGPFRLDPGASNDVIVGAVWVNEGFQYPCPSFDAILQADRKAQALFDNNFKLKNGPDAPNMIIRELDQELILALWNDTITSNNAFEAYSEKDPVLEAQGFDNDTYEFQGYKVYQLANVGVSSAEYNDPDKARLVAVVDIQDGVTDIVNYAPSSEINNVLLPDLKVSGSDSGIKRIFQIKEDLFATGDKKLINNQRYFFSVIAYGYNAHEAYDPNNPSATAQLEPYIEGRNKIEKYTGIPHVITPQDGGIIINTTFGDGPEIKQISGTGNGGQFLNLTDASISTILADGSIEAPTYANAAGPINIEIFDPLRIPATAYTLKITNASETSTILSGESKWTLYDKSTGSVVAVSDTSINRSNAQAVPNWENHLGFTINIEQQEITSGSIDNNIGAEVRFANAQNQWLSLFPDAEGISVFNWIKAGSFTNSDNSDYNDNRVGSAGDFFDPEQLYETIGDGRFAPYCLTNHKPGSGTDRILAPACTDCSSQPTLNLEELSSVDLVFTDDKTLWTDCIVVETGSDASINEGKASKNSLREQVVADATAVSNLTANEAYFVAGSTASYITYTENGEEQQIIGNTFFRPTASTGFNAFNNAVVYNAADVGRSQFPGYAINVETGERLNIIFGENSFLGNENGKDLKFNPTSTIITQNGFTGPQAVALGGQHFVYVMGTRYDGGASHQEKLINYAISTESDTPNYATKLDVYDDAMWVTIPFLTPGFSFKSETDGLIPTDVNIKLRVARPYKQADAETKELEYEFDFSNLAAQRGQTDIAKSAFDLVKIVPNPYYAYSTYESNALDRQVKFTNLPLKTNISIFTLEGTLIKTIATDNTGLDTSAGAKSGYEIVNTAKWDVKNSTGIPVASGVYLIHIEAPDLGEEITLKWFCMNRPTDLDVF